MNTTWFKNAESCVLLIIVKGNFAGERYLSEVVTVMSVYCALRE